MSDGIDQRHRVLLVGNTLAGGGAERFLSTVLAHLDRARFSPELALFRDEITYPIPDDVPVHIVRRVGPLKIPGLIGGMARLLKQRQPESVLGNYAFPNVILNEAIRLSGIRPNWLASVANSPYHVESTFSHAPVKRVIMRAWAGRAYKSADRIVPVSTGLSEDLVSMYPKIRRRITALNIPLDFEQIDAQARQNPAVDLPDAPYAVAVGRLTHQKRYDIMIDAFAKAGSAANWHLVICGDGEDREVILARAADRGIRDRLHLTGFQTNPYSIVAGANLFLMSSDYEGFGIALAEAQGIGIPAISTDSSGPRDIIVPEQTGWLVPPNEADSFAACIDNAIQDYPKLEEMGKAARTTARARFGVGTVVRKLESLLIA